MNTSNSGSKAKRACPLGTGVVACAVALLTAGFYHIVKSRAQRLNRRARRSTLPDFTLVR